MSSDSRPSFRTYSKNKLKKLIKPNITSSIREHLISNETYHRVIEKSRNLTDNVIDRTGLGELKNKTGTFFNRLIPSDDNSTIPKGFYDSLFSPQTANDVYLKVTIISLWIIAMLCILLTIITMFIPVKTNEKRATGAKWIFFHIFLCELFYLIYLFLSMINVGLDFQLNSFWCDIAIYGMYATVPLMYFALLFLSFERLITFFNLKTSLTKIFTNAFVTQVILTCFWAVGIILVSIIMYAKSKLRSSATELTRKIVPKRFTSVFGTMFSSDHCSIDGQLLPAFKILFIILFIILIVLIIKSSVLSVFYGFISLSCLQKNKKKPKNQKHQNDHMTIIFVLFLFLNLVFSFPFYLISTGNSIVHTFRGGKPFPTILKLSFILRLSSIILQCLIFLILESNSWNLLNKLLHRVTCKRSPTSTSNKNRTKESTRLKPTQKSSTSASDTELDDNEAKPDRHKKNGVTQLPTTDESDDDDEVFLDDSKKKSPKAKKSPAIKKLSTDEDETDDEIKTTSKQKSSTQKKVTTGKLSHKKEKIEKEKPPMIERTTSKSNHTNGLSKQKSNGKSTAQRIPSATIDRQTSKSKTNQKHTEYDSIPSDSSPDEISNASVNSDDDVKPPPTKPKTQPTTRSSSNQQNGTSTVSPTIHSSSNQQNGTSTVSPTIHSSSNQQNGTSTVSPTIHSSSNQQNGTSTVSPTIHSSSNQQNGTSTVSPTTHSSSNQQNGTSIVSPITRSSSHQRRRTTHAHATRLRRTTSNHRNHSEVAKLRRKSPRNTNDHSEEPKQDRLSKIYANSHEV